MVLGVPGTWPSLRSAPTLTGDGLFQHPGSQGPGGKGWRMHRHWFPKLPFGPAGAWAGPAGWPVGLCSLDESPGVQGPRHLRPSSTREQMVVGPPFAHWLSWLAALFLTGSNGVSRAWWAWGHLPRPEESVARLRLSRLRLYSKGHTNCSSLATALENLASACPSPVSSSCLCALHLSYKITPWATSPLLLLGSSMWILCFYPFGCTIRAPRRDGVPSYRLSTCPWGSPLHPQRGPLTCDHSEANTVCSHLGEFSKVGVTREW